jgi:copper chaperone CopZ
MRCFLTAILFIALLPISSFAEGLQHVKQTIYGMDCAPCAYGVEKSLKGLDGVDEVTVSLNEGYAELRLHDGGQTTLAEIRGVIQKNGFTPKNAVVTVSGVLTESDDNSHLVLETETGVFLLEIDDEHRRTQLATRLGERVQLVGTIPAEDERVLSVTSIG